MVRPEVVDFLPPQDELVQAREVLTKTVPKARVIPNRVVMSTTEAQYERWKQATSKELQAFLKTVWKAITPELRARYLAAKKKVVMQLLVFSLKPITAEKKAPRLMGDEYEKAHSSAYTQGQNHEGFQVQNSTTNADADLLRLFLAVQANPKHVLASFDVSNAFLNPELSEDVLSILIQPALNTCNSDLSNLASCTSALKHAMDCEKRPNDGKKPETRH